MRKTTKKRPLLVRFGIPTGLVLLGLVLLAFALLRLAQFGPVPQEMPISAVLNMADQHQLSEVAINGDDVLATAKNGLQYHAMKEDGQSLTDLLRHDGVVVDVDTGEGGQWVQGAADFLLIALILGAMYFFIRRGTGGQVMTFSRSKAKRFNEAHPSVLFRDVAGVEEAKVELQEIVEFLKHPERFSAMGARTPKGVLLVGAPGTGKTLISRAVAGEAGVPFYSVSGSEFVEMFVGVGAARVRDLFKEAKEHAPCILFIDEIDAVGRQRSTTGMGGGNDEREQTLNQLLVEMDGFDKQTNVVVIAATNRPDVLDQALLRPGRFDRRVMLDKPDIRGRLAILEVHAKDKPLAPEVTLHEIARQTAGFSGADLANLLNEAALLAARNEQTAILKKDLDEAALRVMAGPERKSRLITEAEKAIIAHHEVGHAIVMRSMPGADPVQKVTAIARGMALGITVQSPTEDRYLMRRSELLAKMAGAMGGRAAEELIFGDITTGASQDIEYVTSIARRMVCEFGMSPLGLISLKVDADGSTSVSPETSARIDQEVGALVEQAYTTALNILREKKDKLVMIAEYLMQVETIDGAELDELLFAA
jgi:cell division protease FtsH